MKLIDLLSVITDNTKVTIWRDNKPVSFYDGKESIDESLNNEIVKVVRYGAYETINVEI